MNSTFLKTIFIALISAVLWSCGSSSSEESIESLEAKLKEVTSGNGINHDEVREVMGKLASAYEKAALDNPEAPETPENLYTAAELFETNMMNVGKAMEIFDKIINDYPQHERAADALFKKGYVYHNTLKDLEKAKEAYMSFIERYPNHQLASSAKFEIENLGISAKDLLEKIQETNAADSVPAQQ